VQEFVNSVAAANDGFDDAAEMQLIAPPPSPVASTQPWTRAEVPPERLSVSHSSLPVAAAHRASSVATTMEGTPAVAQPVPATLGPVQTKKDSRKWSFRHAFGCFGHARQ